MQFQYVKDKNKDTKPEIIIRKWLWKNNYRYMLHATCYMLHATCYMLHATCYMLKIFLEDQILYLNQENLLFLFMAAFGMGMIVNMLLYLYPDRVSGYRNFRKT
ncbi:hypothetical protein RC86_09565 [Pectobacterium brasiliense]|nr:hypothetical protein RC86_09565 [Pectobacterium brasiliense]